MNHGTLTPHWDAADSRRLGALVAVMVVMTLVALGLRWRLRSEKGRAVARDFGARTLGWWLLVLAGIPTVLAGGWIVLAGFGLMALVTWSEFNRVLVAGSGPGWRLLGFIFCVLLLGCAPALALRFGPAWLFYVLVVVQVGDVLQYVCGKAFGRHPFAPWLSPKKTWEGYAGGIAGAALLGAALAPVVGLDRAAGTGWGFGLALAGSASGMVMSAVKRRHGVKDFGAWLPGHGGLLDRLDSLCGAAAFAYVCLSVRL
jgi:predicted CDP-diglyceride synthetase/phosphatidate cytidylyltransferase